VLVLRYFGFRGRASLAEYWWYTLFSWIVFRAVYNAEALLGGWVVLTALPGLAVTVRRLHDTRRSGWNVLWSLTGIGAFAVLYWLTLPSDANTNAWGPPDPL
jgi:uncharacterized membrane protein YhaH (DUF805 family)